MNDISWFLYFTDIVRGLQTLIGWFSPLIMIVGVILICASLITDTVKNYHSGAKYGYEYDETIVYPWAFLKLWGIPIIILGFLFSIMAVLIPSRETMYMIAASQIGEQVIQLEEVQNVGGEVGGLAKDTIELLRQQIQEQLTEKPVESP